MFAVQETVPPFAVVGDDWESLTMAGLAAVEAQDRNRWYLGDLAGRVATVYGQSSLNKFAGDIRIPRVKTLRDYERTAQFYDLSARADYPTLSYSHFREAMRDKANAIEWLTKAADNNWPVVKLGQEIRKSQGKVVTVKHVFDVHPNDNGTLTIAPDDRSRYSDLLAVLDSHPDWQMKLVVQWEETDPDQVTGAV